MNNNSSNTEDRVGQALRRMYRRRIEGIKYNLDTMRELLRRLDNPHCDFAAIHVAGTNGKGSVCAMIESVLRARGLQPGLYTSPHLLRFHERIRIAGHPISSDALMPLIELAEQADRAAASAPGGRPATFFEFSTALAFLYFQQNRTRVAVIETGLGGRLDATNLLTPALSVLTRIALDHAEWLGPDLAAVAAEKAGIIKPHRPVVCGAMPEEALSVIRRTATERQAALIMAEQTVSVQPLRRLDGERYTLKLCGALTDYGRLQPALQGDYQMENLATAVAALETFSRIGGIEIDAKTMKTGLQTVEWPARFQKIHDDPPVLLDGAHNPSGVTALMNTVKKTWKRRPVALITGICADKDYEAMLRVFQRSVQRCWTVSFSSERALDAHDLARAAARLGSWEVGAATLDQAIPEAIAWARERDGIVLVAGSLFLAADVLATPRD